MTLLETLILAIVEGLTEFLPISSTGHMIIAQNLLGIESTPFVKAFTIIIQFGAILSVLCLYFQRFFKLNNTPADPNLSLFKRLLHKFDFYVKLLVAFIPAVVIGLLGKKSGIIDRFLEHVEVVAIMLVVGGIFMLFCDKLFEKKSSEETPLTNKRAFLIGCFQCLAMIPGVSRSMATIVGGMSQRLTRRAAAEFSFFLAIPTMAGATVLDVYEVLFKDPNSVSWATGDNIKMLLIGCVVAFVVALLAMKWFVNFLAKYGFKAFGYYRIVVGLFILVWLMLGYNLSMVD
ncbi:undecaprenyl-diphosphate phosphatase [Hoylesella nanceiensis]|uniref:undecaprenyl-diphosphate phosphatase n=1 Tax=Hoylesella nanceiensis TaxID=425941 RepID=UPI0028E719B9|nr:undecaprenyl-diphosphate phosphatase [Hoylesella nanceiensis]